MFESDVFEYQYVLYEDAVSRLAKLEPKILTAGEHAGEGIVRAINSTRWGSLGRLQRYQQQLKEQKATADYYVQIQLSQKPAILPLDGIKGRAYDGDQFVFDFGSLVKVYEYEFPVMFRGSSLLVVRTSSSLPTLEIFGDQAPLIHLPDDYPVPLAIELDRPLFGKINTLYAAWIRQRADLPDVTPMQITPGKLRDIVWTTSNLAPVVISSGFVPVNRDSRPYFMYTTLEEFEQKFGSRSPQEATF